MDPLIGRRVGTTVAGRVASSGPRKEIRRLYRLLS
ncbi:unnamed protein product [Penicillium roqueforti FM164]|uniref:Genomic scaffold, ProqFM164S01 n=1 Tax=Penicillium roqueforti (strain FM164) TaxID=1365484 RepID=W6QJV4_PENRF|nr:unnamed protein product [Penicillium roqueforti FM164]